jgi:hypothetical protein
VRSPEPPCQVAEVGSAAEELQRGYSYVGGTAPSSIPLRPGDAAS